MTTAISDNILTLTAVMAPGKGCVGHVGTIPGGAAYEDQHGWVWCIACAKHLVACTDEDCGHPAAVFAEAGSERPPGDQAARCEHGDNCDVECAASLMSDESDLSWDELWGDWDDDGDADGAE